MPNVELVDELARLGVASTAVVAVQLNLKVDKVAGYGLSQESFTTAEKAKLAGLQSEHYKGTHPTLAALEAAWPTASAGDYADVDGGVGTDAREWLWDVTDAKWVPSNAPATSLTAAQVKSLYESNPDTYAFTGALKTKIDGIAAGATANSADAALLARSNHTGAQAISTVTGLTDALLAAGKTCIPIACSDETTALTAGTGKVTFRMPFALTGVTVRASLTTPQASGNLLTIDVKEGGASIFSTKPTFDNAEKTTTTALTPAVVSDASLAEDAEITIDISQIGDGTAKGLKVYILGNK